MMAKAPPSFDFYYNDFLGGVTHLTSEEIGCYLLLLIYQWQNGYIPNDPLVRKHICGIADMGSWERIWRHVADKFEPVDLPDEQTVLVNMRMHEDREFSVENWMFQKAKQKAKPTRDELSKIRSYSGKQGGRPRGSKSKKKQMKAKKSKWEEGRGKREGSEEIEKLSTIPEGLREIVGEWLAYKRERREGYKPRGLQALLLEVTNTANAKSEGVVADLMRRAMANGWKGWNHPGSAGAAKQSAAEWRKSVSERIEKKERENAARSTDPGAR
jgi:uncharacterized protein YdaU (DUF1376 family)